MQTDEAGRALYVRLQKTERYAHPKYSVYAQMRL